MLDASVKDIATLKKKLAQSGTRREDYWDESAGVHEYTFALNATTLELVAHDGPRDGADDWKKSFDYHTWVTGTIDWYEAGTPRIDDLKTGAFPVWAKDSRQLRTYALVPWVQAGCPFHWEIRVSITQWPRYPLGGQPQRHWHTLTGFDMTEHLDDVRWALAHPNEVNVVPADEESGKLSPCSGCECREPFPASSWMQNFWYRSLPHCFAGTKKLIMENN